MRGQIVTIWWPVWPTFTCWFGWLEGTWEVRTWSRCWTSADLSKMCSIPCDVKGSNCAFCPSSKEMAHGFTFCVSAKEILKSQLSMNSDHVTLKRRPTHSMNRLETNCSGSSLHRPGLGLVCRFLSNCVSRRSCQLTSFSHCAKQQQLTVMSSGLWLASTWRGRPYLSLFFCLSVQTQRCVTETKKKKNQSSIFITSSLSEIHHRETLILFMNMLLGVS